MASLGEEYPVEQARCRELLKSYQEIGPAGVFGAAFIEDTLRRADRAAVGGDLVEMIRCFKEMEGLK